MPPRKPLSPCTDMDWATMCSMVKDLHTEVLGNGEPELSLRARLHALEAKMRYVLGGGIAILVAAIAALFK